jgi:large subunit ribosomal protein L25
MHLPAPDQRSGLDFAAVAEERFKLDVLEREEVGSRAVRRLRKEGLIPGVLYGRGNKPHSISVPERDLRRALTGGHGLHAILDVVLQGQKTTHPSILKEYQQDPLRGRVTHIDLQEVRLDQPIHAMVTVELVGQAAGVKEGGVLSQSTREVQVEALPMEIPDRLELDVSSLGIGDSLRVSDLAATAGVRILDDEDEVLASVTPPTVVVEPEVEEGEELEGEELPEGAEAAAEGAEAAEPEEPSEE